MPVPRKYYLVQQDKSWSDAQTYCRANHTDLATIETSAEMTQLETEAQKHRFSSSAWIGLYKYFHDWRWSLGNESLGSYTSWFVGQPNNLGTVEECGFTCLGFWQDIWCTRLLAFICFDDRNIGTSRYIFYSNAKSWYDAQTYCRLYHTDLASSRDSTENAVIQEMTPVWTHFGLIRTSWSWSDQTKTSSIMWAAGEPHTIGLGSFCGYVNNGQVFDTLCSDVRSFFCFSVITGQHQIIRMKVQSDQNLNDPALMALILEQILQKMKEHGLENVVVKWREQPGGKIFQKLN